MRLPLLLASVLLLLNCSYDELKHRIAREAISSVSGAFEGQAPTLDAKANFWGQGMLVFNRPEPPGVPCIWVALYSYGNSNSKGLLTVGEQCQHLTPSVPLLDSAKDEVKKAVGLTHVARDEILRYLDGEAPTTPPREN